MSACSSATGGTIGYLVNGDGALAVDSQFVPTRPRSASPGLKQRAPKGIDMLINTHHHGDHTGGNLAFRRAVKSIVAHENVRGAGIARRDRAGGHRRRSRRIADTTFDGDLDDDVRRRNQVWAPLLRRRAYQRRRGDHLREGQRRAHGRPAVQPRPPAIDRPGRRVDRSTGSRCWTQRRAMHASSDTIFIVGHAKDNTVTVGQGPTSRASATT